MAKYDPVVFPPEELSNRKVFTCSLHNLLVSNNKKPVLFVGNIDDITQAGDRFVIHFISSLSRDFPLDNRRVFFHLTCRHGDVESLIKIPPSEEYFVPPFLKQQFIVVAAVTEVKKIAYHFVRASDQGFEIESPDAFSISGGLIKMVRLRGDYLLQELTDKAKK
jgi:hypothetical protein